MSDGLSGKSVLLVVALLFVAIFGVPPFAEWIARGGLWRLSGAPIRPGFTWQDLGFANRGLISEREFRREALSTQPHLTFFVNTVLLSDLLGEERVVRFVGKGGAKLQVEAKFGEEVRVQFELPHSTSSWEDSIRLSRRILEAILRHLECPRSEEVLLRWEEDIGAFRREGGRWGTPSAFQLMPIVLGGIRGAPGSLGARGTGKPLTSLGYLAVDRITYSQVTFYDGPVPPPLFWYEVSVREGRIAEDWNVETSTQEAIPFGDLYRVEVLGGKAIFVFPSRGVDPDRIGTDTVRWLLNPLGVLDRLRDAKNARFCAAAVSAGVYTIEPGKVRLYSILLPPGGSVILTNEAGEWATVHN